VVVWIVNGAFLIKRRILRLLTLLDGLTPRMNVGRAQKLITLYVIMPAAVIYVGLRFYAQFRHVDVYVSRLAPMPVELASGLHMEEHKIAPIVRIESPYDSAAEKPLPPEEIRRLRRVIAWTSSMPAFIDSLTILNPSDVVARLTSKSVMRENRLIKDGNRWMIVRATRQQVHRYSGD